ncbi:hypothetical protein [Synechococcus sp. RS9917]|uniref:hypothetical protein n=1 Tax=Synechococcus sp. RS9917 TaxID=221360 RepID=UPI00031502DA|nr:hypothetical protein [Synechococcus sp. RS9917]
MARQRLLKQQRLLTHQGLLHRLGAWLRVEQQLSAPVRTRGHGRQQRVRLRQRQALLRQLLEALPERQRLNLRPSGWWFWRALRWGGPGLLLGWILAQR